MSEVDQSAPLLQPARPKKTDCEPCTVGAPLYMATFSDMAILLMAFFVLLLSMTEIDLKTWQKITGQIRLAFGTQSINLDFVIPTARSMTIDDFSPNEAAREVTLDVRQRMETEGELIVRNTETYQNQFDIEREFLILQASLESEIERGEVIVKIQDEQLVVEVPETSQSAGKGEDQSEDRSGIVSQQLISASAKVAQIQSEITRDINVFATRESSIESNEDSTAKLLNKLQFTRVDEKKFSLVKILKILPKQNSLFETVLVSANDELVNQFLNKNISYNDINQILTKIINRSEFKKLKKILPRKVSDVIYISKYVRYKIKSLYL